MSYIVTVKFKIRKVNGETEDLELSSDILQTEIQAEQQKEDMIAYWGAYEANVEFYDSEPADDGYDYDKYY